MGIESNVNFLSRFQNKARITIFSIPNILKQNLFKCIQACTF